MISRDMATSHSPLDLCGYWFAVRLSLALPTIYSQKPYAEIYQKFIFAWRTQSHMNGDNKPQLIYLSLMCVYVLLNATQKQNEFKILIWLYEKGSTDVHKFQS